MCGEWALVFTSVFREIFGDLLLGGSCCASCNPRYATTLVVYIVLREVADQRRGCLYVDTAVGEHGQKCKLGSSLHDTWRSINPLNDEIN